MNLFKLYFSPRGRINRKTYFSALFLLFIIVPLILGAIIAISSYNSYMAMNENLSSSNYIAPNSEIQQPGVTVNNQSNDLGKNTTITKNDYSIGEAPQETKKMKQNNTLSIVTFIVAISISYVVIHAQFVLMIKRVHDFGKSGYMSLLILIPFVGWLFPWYLLFPKGDDGENQYGKAP